MYDEYTYYDIFVADAYAAVLCRICVGFLWIIIRQTFLGTYVISLFDYDRRTWIQSAIVEQVLLKKKLNFKM